MQKLYNNFYTRGQKRRKVNVEKYLVHTQETVDTRKVLVIR